MTLVIMAAGIGSRYGGLKQVDPVGPHGELIIHYSVFDALRAGFRRIVFVIRRDIAETFHERIGRLIEAHADIAYAFQELDDLPAGRRAPAGRTKPWGTAHAVWCCRHAVQTSFGVINADDFYGAAAFRTLAGHLRHAHDRPNCYDFAMVAYPLANTLSEHGSVARGVCAVANDGALLGVAEHTRIQMLDGDIVTWRDGDGWTPLAPQTPVSMNFWGFTPAIFAELDARLLDFTAALPADRLASAELYLPNVVGDLVQAGQARVQVLPTQEQWFGVTYQADRPRVQAALRALTAQGVYPTPLWSNR